MSLNHAIVQRLALCSLLLLPSAIFAATDPAVFEALKSKGVKEPEAISYIDLTRDFGTTSNWALAVVQENVPPDPDWNEHGPIFICFLKERSPTCLEGSISPMQIHEKEDRIPFYLFDARIVQASPDGQNPRLLVKTCTERSGDGNCDINTTLYAYNRTTDRFDPVFHNDTWSNRNELTRFIESGPLRSDIIVTYPTSDAPYTYWVEVYRQQGDGKYTQILRYRGKTEYGDNNRLAVVDSEMPETLRRLGMWKSGDTLPIPAKLPAECSTLFMRNGVEWCK